MTTVQSPENVLSPVGPLDGAEIGKLLCETREALKRDLEDVAAELRIRFVYLQAIEEGRFDDLPGPAYITGFLRAYGDFLGLDGEGLVVQFKESGGGAAGQTDLHLPSPVEEGRLPTGSIMLVAAVLAAGAYGGWYYMSTNGRDPVELVSKLPAQFMAMIGGESGATEGTATQPVPEQVAQLSPQAGEPVQPVDAEPDVTTADSAPQQAAAELEPEPEPETASTAVEPVTEAPDAAVEEESSQPTESASAEPAVELVRPKVETTESPVVVADQISRPEPPPPIQAIAEAVAPPAPAAPQVPAPVAATPELKQVAEESAPPPVAVQAPPPRRIVAIARPSAEQISSEEVPPPPAVSEEAAEPNQEIAIQTAAADPIRMAATETVHWIILRADTDSWVEIRSGDARPVLSRVMRAGETFEVPAQSGLKLITGNAGGIEILVDGKAIPRLGPIGAVRRNIAMDAQSLLADSGSRQ